MFQLNSTKHHSVPNASEKVQHNPYTGICHLSDYKRVINCKVVFIGNDNSSY
jgi:hypothetical protein